MIAVTGATGKLGRLVIQGLLDREPADQIIAAVRDPASAADLAARGVDVRLADYNQPDTLLPALDGADRLLLISTNDPVNTVAQHANVIDAAKRVGVDLLVYTSVTLATFPPRATEPTIRESGLPFTILRNAQYTSVYSQQIKQAVATGVFLGSAGDGRTATATHADYAAAATEVLTGTGHVGRVYELSGDLAWSFQELTEELSSATGKEVVYQNVSTEKHLEILLAAGVPAMLAPVFVASYRAVAAGEFSGTSGELRRLIGHPTTTLAESVAAILDS
jgi:NAD(P)H dehydrogenase (quinone)